MKKEEIQELALQAIIPHMKSGVHMTMGSGKTFLGLQYIDYFYFQNHSIKILVVGPNKAIFKAWKDDAEKFNLSHLLPLITFSTYLSLNKQDLDYDILLLDEAHSLKNSSIPYVANHKGKILGLSGTPPKLDHTERGILMNLYWPIRYTYETDDAVEDGILNDYRIIVHSLELDKTKTLQKKTKAGKVWYTSEENEYDYWTKRLNESTSMKETQIMRVMRMKALMGFPSKEKLAKKLLGEIQGKTIVFANTIEQCRRLCTYTFDSKNPDSESNLHNFSEGKIRVLGCVLQLSQGINVKNLTHGIVLHSYGNERKLLQRFGRLCRLDPGETAELHILCYTNSIDKVWCKNALEDLDQTKITWL